MTGTHLRHLSVIVLLCVVGPATARAISLDYDQDAYGLGMGSAVAAGAGGIHAIQWNPAGVARAADPAVRMGIGYIADPGEVPLDGSVLYPLPDKTVVAFSVFSVLSNSQDTRAAYIGTLALPLDEAGDFLVGLNLKFLAFSVAGPLTCEKGRGLGLDLGLTYDLRRGNDVLASFGIAIKDVDTEIRFENGNEEALARAFVFGTAFMADSRTRIELDYSVADRTLQTVTGTDFLRVGAERTLDDGRFAVRAGYDGLFRDQGFFSLGAGLRPGDAVELDYAMRVASLNSRTSHYLTLVYRFMNANQPAGKVAVETVEAAPPTMEPTIKWPTPTPTRRATAPPSPTPTPAKSPTPAATRGIVVTEGGLVFAPDVFSPAGKPDRATLTFPDYGIGETAQWQVLFLDPSRKIVGKIAGKGALPASLSWNGLDAKGKGLPDGKYMVSLTGSNRKNEAILSDTGTVEIGIPRARISLLVTHPYLSNRSARKSRNGVLFTVLPQGSSTVQAWDFEVREGNTNRVVYKTKGQNRLPKSISWNGRGGKNSRLPDGVYLCLLTARDRTGNSMKSDSLRVLIHSVPPKLTLRGEDHWADFSSGRKFLFTLGAADPIGIQDWRIEILDEFGRLRRKFAGSGAPPDQAAWDGKSDLGEKLPPGLLVRAVFTAFDRAGNFGTVGPVAVQLDVPAASSEEQMTLNLTTVYFVPMGVDLTETGRAELDKAAASIRPYLNKSSLVVKGYAAPDEKGDLMFLSYQRAVHVKNYLVKALRIPPSEIPAVGYSTRDSKMTQAVPARGNARRRADITLTTKR